MTNTNDARAARADVVMLGAGLGGIAATLAAAKAGLRVVLTEPTDWIGGQLTSQAVPPDEHRWIEDGWSSTSYQALRAGIRAAYRRDWPLTPAVRANDRFNPGHARVSQLCHEPRVGLRVLESMLEPWVASGRVRVLLDTEPVAASTDGDRVTGVTVRRRDGSTIDLEAPWFVDATELGDLISLAGIEHVVGAEGRDDTGELHAPEQADPGDQQAVTWCFALERRVGEDHTIDRPADFDRWSAYQAPFWPNRQLSLSDVNPHTLEHRSQPLFGSDVNADPLPGDWWTYRRIRAAHQFGDPLTTDVSLVNWPQIDAWVSPLIPPGPDGDAAAAVAAGKAEAKSLARSFLYWLQTECPRPDGGTGWPELRPAPEVTGTDDGFAKAVYVREARRIRARFTVLEHHVGVEAREAAGMSARSEPFADSVGIGAYRIDLHPSTGGRTYVDVSSHPFQIPLGALVPERMRNVLPANKNIGTTHITNGCYRLHPVEWAIGEAVGALVGFCAAGHADEPAQVHEDTVRLEAFQHLLADRHGVPLAWPEEVAAARL